MEKIKEIENLKKQRAKMRQKQFEKDQKLVSMSNGMHDEADDEEKLRLTRNSFKTECLEDIKGQQQQNRHRRVDYSNPRASSNFSTATNSSMSIHLPPSSDDDDSPQPDPEREHRQHQLRIQAGIHGRQLAEYKSKSKSLELQKQEIDLRLRQLDLNPHASHMEMSNLQQLHEQEARNQQALEMLRSQVKGVGTRSALRQLYLRQGGTHASILSQLADLEAEAKLIEQNEQLAYKKKQKQYSSIEEQLLSFELENQRLQQELLGIQDRNNKLLTRKANGYSDESEAEYLRRRQDVYRQRLDDLENEMELLRRQAKLANLKKELQQEKPVQPLVYENTAEIPLLLQPNQPTSVMDVADLSYGPYDPNAGFVVFYDFVNGLDPSLRAVRLVVSLYNNTAQYGQPSVLPTVYADGSSTHVGGMFISALVSAKQPVPRCPPSPHLYLVVELQAAAPGGHLSSRGWCRLNLFDSTSRLRSGRLRVPFRILPIRPGCSSAELNSMPQYGIAELFLRVVHFRDADVQSMVTVSQNNDYRYLYPPQVQPSSQTYVPPPPSVTPPDSPDSAVTASHHRDHPYDPESRDIGFQVIRVKNAEHGEGKVRVTAYYHSNSHIVQSDISPVTASTNIVMSNFKHNYHVFGQQEAIFHSIDLQPDIILVIRFYLRKRLHSDETDDLEFGPGEDFGIDDDEDLVAWASMPLMTASHKGVNTEHLEDYKINVGTHTLHLYHAPVPEIESIPLEGRKVWQTYNKATVRINIFVSTPQPGSLTPSEASDEDNDDFPPAVWLPYERPHPPSEPFHSTDGFDLYIDGCRYLPDCVTFTRVAGRILSRQYTRLGKDLNTSVRLDSDIYNAVYDYRVEIREPNISPTATLLLKVYTVGRFSKQLTVAGFATLNIFVQRGSNEQPPSDTAGTQLSLNEGCHQLRLYQSGPDGTGLLYNNCLRDAGIRYVPCASILVRLYKAPVGPQGTILKAEKVPQSDWLSLGIYRKPPRYSDRTYLSMDCKPTHGECQLLQSLVQRPKVSLRESLEFILEPAELRQLRTEKDVAHYIRNQLTRMMDIVPIDIDLTYIAKYSPVSGIKFALDGAMNLPWSNFTYAHYCLNPPGAFYQGKPYGAYDKPVFTQLLDPSSSNKSPLWKDGFKHFKSRSHHRYLTVIIHLQEVKVITSKKNYKYGLLNQAWTAVPVFSDDYVHTKSYQLPLFQGGPSPYILKQLAQQHLLDWIRDGLTKKSLKLLEGASVFVRLADGRRDDELPGDIPEDINVTISTELLPENLLEKYELEQNGRSLHSLIPQGKNPEEFFTVLSTKFKSLVYKLYEDGIVNKT
ncbi:hypothetical protein LSH36_211g01013 [Paralvinella palmiformis]|uniref:Uncharacterized protein n=1 Tax=Paralvinella palmiformis TaxID=53620 RepID=A0AAD9JQX3_9ANNE|nr:hypothetical protein LSH36_211g01013 [Paralvinella palmiformis]